MRRLIALHPALFLVIAANGLPKTPETGILEASAA
jgi:hypothetical protein